MKVRSGGAVPLLMVFAAAVLAGCGSNPPKPTVLNATLVVSPEVNPDIAGRPSPVAVRLYELASLGAFNVADFFSLQDNDAAVLGADLLAKEDLRFTPGESRTLERELRDGTQFVGVVASYRDLENAQWRAAVEVTPNKTNQVTVSLDALAVSVSAGGK